VASLKDFVQKCVIWGETFSVEKWREGVFVVGPMRVVVLPQGALMKTLSEIPGCVQEEIGRWIGSSMKSFISIRDGLDPEKRENWVRALSELSRIGLGRVGVKADACLEVDEPALPILVSKAIIESLLSVSLRPVQLQVEVYLFRIREPGQ